MYLSIYLSIISLHKWIWQIWSCLSDEHCDKKQKDVHFVFSVLSNESSENVNLFHFPHKPYASNDWLEKSTAKALSEMLKSKLFLFYIICQTLNNKGRGLPHTICHHINKNIKRKKMCVCLCTRAHVRHYVSTKVRNKDGENILEC